MTKKRGPLALIVIDGWGYSAAREGNAIELAATPFYDELCEKYPRTLLEAHGSRVGLPAGVMGNSEVGHLNIGSGRVIRMDVSLVDHEIETGEFFQNVILTTAIESARHPQRALHLMGLCSDGQVHSSLTHLYALLKMAKDHGLDHVFIHCFLDGRDTPPRSAGTYVSMLQRKLDEIGCGEIATICRALLRNGSRQTLGKDSTRLRTVDESNRLSRNRSASSDQRIVRARCNG